MTEQTLQKIVEMNEPTTYTSEPIVIRVGGGEDIGAAMRREVRKAAALLFSRTGEEVPAEPVTPLTRGAKAGRNDPCPCGSGKKYKRCCR